MRFDRSAFGLKRFRMLWAALALSTAVGFVAAAAAEPIFSHTGTIDAPPGVTVTVLVDDVFDNAGTNPSFTRLRYGTVEYIDPFGIGIDFDSPDRMSMTVKTAAELNDLPSPPPSPFTDTVDVWMTNDEGQTATGTITFETTYVRTSAAPLPQPDEPVFSQTAAIDAPPGATVTVLVDEVFDNAGTNPRFSSVGHHATEHGDSFDIDFDPVSPDRMTLTARTAAELNALSPPPPSPFTVTVDVRMINDEGQEASGTIAFRTTYERTSALPAQPGGETMDEGRTTYKFRLVNDLARSTNTYIRCGSSGSWTTVVTGDSADKECNQSTAQRKLEGWNAIDTPHDCPSSEPVLKLRYYSFVLGANIRNGIVSSCVAS